MHKHRVKFITVLLISFFAYPGKAANETNQLHWTASKGTKTLFILGSIHVANQSFYPLEPVIYKHLKSSNALIVEVNDLESTESANYANQISRLPKGDKITDTLSQQDINRATKLGERLGVPFSAFQHKKLWYYGMVMASIQSIKMGYQPQWGIDLHMIQQAKQNSLPIIALETSKAQIDMIDSIPVSPSEFNLIMDDIESAQSMIIQLINAWQIGDLNMIDELMKKSFETSPEMEDILITQRNLNWIHRLHNLLNNYEQLFLVVGAGHLPGDQGLLNLLKMQGFNVEPSL